MGLICQTCGSKGWKRLLVPCSKCSRAYEHCYCMKEHSFEVKTDFVCSDCSVSPVKNRLASDLTKVVPSNRKNKARVESSNPVPRWKSIPNTSKVKLISPEEVRKLSRGGNKTGFFKVPKPVTPPSTVGLTKQTVCVPRARGLNSAVVARKRNPNLLPSVEPPSSRGLQIQPRVIQQAAKSQVVEGKRPRVSDGANNLCSKEICQTIVSEKLLQLLPYRPTLHSTWKGRIVDSAIPAEFNGEFWAQPASLVHKKAHRLSKAIPVLLNVRLLPVGRILNDLLANRSPALSDVEIYIFQDEKNTDRFNGKHFHLSEAMTTRNCMININIKGAQLLIFSSKLLDESSQIIIKMQKKTNNFLWGFFLHNKRPLTLLPVTFSQTAKQSDDPPVANKNTHTSHHPDSRPNQSKRQFHHDTSPRKQPEIQHQKHQSSGR